MYFLRARSLRSWATGSNLDATTGAATCVFASPLMARFARCDPEATSCSPLLLFLLMFYVLVLTACDHEP